MARSQLASEIATARQEVDAWSMGRRAFHEMGQTPECPFCRATLYPSLASRFPVRTRRDVVTWSVEILCSAGKAQPDEFSH